MSTREEHLRIAGSFRDDARDAMARALDGFDPWAHRAEDEMHANYAAARRHVALAKYATLATKEVDRQQTSE